MEQQGHSEEPVQTEAPQASTEAPISSAANAADNDNPPLREVSNETKIPEEAGEPLTRQVTPERRRGEIGLLATNVLERKMRAIEKRLQDAPDQASEAQILSDEGTRKVNSLRTLQDEKVGQYTTTDSQGDAVAGIRLDKGSEINVMYQGEQYRAIKILGAKTMDTFTVELLSLDKRTRLTSVIIPRKDITTAQLLAEAPAILSTLSDSEKKLVTLYMQHVQSGIPDEALSDEIDATITELGVAAGIPTALDADSFLAAQDQSSPETAQIIAEIRKDLATKNVLDYATTMNMLDRLGCNQESLGVKVQEIQTALAQQQAALAESPEDEGLKKIVEELTEQGDLLTKGAAALGENNAVLEFFKKVEAGKADTETAKQVSEALKSGDMLSIIGMVSPELADSPDDTAEQTAEKDAKRKELAANIAGIGLLGIGAVFALLWKVAVSETKALQKELK